jgi:pilus assembly protein Flp/PilA
MTTIRLSHSKEASQMKNLIASFLQHEQGLTMVEYAIAGALVAAATVTAFTLLGTNIIAKITDLAGFVAS